MPNGLPGTRREGGEQTNPVLVAQGGDEERLVMMQVYHGGPITVSYNCLFQKKKILRFLSVNIVDDDWGLRGSRRLATIR